MEEKEFKLPNSVVPKEKEQTAEQTVLIETIDPCIVGGAYYVGGVKLLCDKAVADALVKAGSAQIV